MIAVPAETGDTTPVSEPTEATAGILLLHVPPGVADVNVTFVPMQDASTPVGVAGSGLMVIGFTE